MKLKFIGTMLFTIGIANAFELNLSKITDSVSQGITSTTSFMKEDKGVTDIGVDNECKKIFENYEMNFSGMILDITSKYGLSMTKNFIGSFTGQKTEPSEDKFNKFAEDVAKNYLWIPLDVEKTLGEIYYNDRAKANKVVLRNTKNLKYKNMYTKVDQFISEYIEYMKKSDITYPFDIKVYITANNKSAEALPNGQILISEDYIKNGNYKTILAHELSHISKRHSIKKVQYMLLSSYNNAKDGIDFIKNIDELNNAEKLLNLLSEKNIKESFSLYPQHQELEADACALRVINGIVPNKKQYFSQELVKNINESPYLKENGSLFSDHPDKKTRIDNIYSLEKKI